MKLDKQLLRKMILQELTLRSRAGGPPKYSGLPDFKSRGPRLPKLRSGVFDDETELFDDETDLLDAAEFEAEPTYIPDPSLSIPKAPQLRTISPFDDDTMELPQLRVDDYDDETERLLRGAEDEQDTEDSEFASYVPGVGFESQPERVRRFDKTARRLSRKDLREMIDRIIKRI